MTNATTIEAARADDLAAVLALLESAKLPTDGLAPHIATTLVARRDGRIVGSAALEVYGAGALLRSVAVDERLRGEGLGHRLTEAALALARHRHVATVYLLTTTAGDFFPRFGFKRIERTAVALAVRTSVEFTSACPDTALVLARDI